MSASFSQRSLHWLELGGGNRLLVRLAFFLLAATVIMIGAWQRFQGPDDRTMEQAVVARQLAEGRGYSTPILWPQSVAVLKARNLLPGDWSPSAEQTLPELYHAPGYPTLLGATLKLVGADYRAQLFEPASLQSGKITQAYRADLLLLAVNVACALSTALLAALLAHRLFGQWAALLTLSGVATSLALAESLTAVDGTSFLALLGVLLAWAWQEGVRAALEQRTRAAAAWIGAGGLVCAALYLTEYTAGLVLLPWLAALVFSAKGHARWLLPLLGLGLFCLAVTPWTLRNVELTGHPMALTGQAVSLKSGDPTAEPLEFRNTDSAEGPTFSLNKFFNKGLKGVETNFSARLWTGGAQLMAAFALAGLIYRFKQARSSHIRWGWIAAWLFCTTGQSFLSSGESPRLAAIWMGPWLIILGAGIAMILLENLRQPSDFMRGALVSGLILFNSAPLVHHLSEPKLLPFRISLHLPGMISEVSRSTERQFIARHLFVTDAPAAYAWYGQKPVWSLPNSYSALMDLHRRQLLAGLFLTPRTMDQALYSKLMATARGEIPADRLETPLKDLPGWAPIWLEILRVAMANGMDTPQFSKFFPFGRLIFLPQLGLGNNVLLLNPSAMRVSQSPR